MRNSEFSSIRSVSHSLLKCSLVVEWNTVFVTLCRLCKDPYNLIRVRDSGGLPILVNVLLDPEKKKLWTYATYTLLQYQCVSFLEFFRCM